MPKKCNETFLFIQPLVLKNKTNFFFTTNLTSQVSGPKHHECSDGKFTDCFQSENLTKCLPIGNV